MWFHWESKRWAVIGGAKTLAHALTGKLQDDVEVLSLLERGFYSNPASPYLAIEQFYSNLTPGQQDLFA